MYLDFYFFNWTNPEQINDNSSSPRVVEMGPYRFKETKEKVNITWNNENSTVSYRQLRRWYYVEEESNGNLDDNVTTLNVIAAVSTPLLFLTSYLSVIQYNTRNAMRACFVIQKSGNSGLKLQS